MSLEKAIADTIERAVRMATPGMITEGVVTAVDREASTCTVGRDGLPNLLGVRLNSVTSPGDDVFTIYPANGSKVLCAIIDNKVTEAIVISANDIQEVSGNIKGLKLSWTKDGIVMNGGGLGGMCITPELVKQLKLNTARIDSIIDILKNTITACSLQPNPGWQAIITPLLAGLQKEDYSGVENNKVKH